MIHVVLASDRNLIRQAGITAMSALQTSSQRVTFTFLSPTEDASDPAWQSIMEVLRAAGAECALLPVVFKESLQLAQHLSSVTYFRLLLPDLLAPTVSRAIYLDCDVLVQRDLADLWRRDMGGKELAAVPDAGFSDWKRLGLDPHGGYFNAGVLLLDLAAIRASNSFHQALEFAKGHPARLTWADQCALNYTFQRRWDRLDTRWNYQYKAFVDDILRLGKRRTLQRAFESVFHFNNYDRPWLPESAHPLKSRYMAVSRTHRELLIRPEVTARALWTRAKRIVKWQVPRLMKRGEERKPSNVAGD